MELSVHITTYNHEKYIARAIEGALLQKTAFEYEIVIGDDHSTDKTAEIINEYVIKYPNKIRPLFHKYNLGPIGFEGKNNFVQTLQACKGKYVAFCDGDDYWNDNDKLQQQVDFLNNNPEFAICFHNMMITYEDSNKEPHSSNLLDSDVFTIEDLAEGNFIYTSSCTFRRNLIGNLPEWFYELKAGDYGFHLLNSQFGKIKYINKIMGVYRIHPQGFWSSQDQVNLFINWIEIQEILIGKFSTKVNKILLNSQTELLYKLFLHFEAHGDSRQASIYLKRLMQSNPEFMYQKHADALKYQQNLLSSYSYRLGHRLLQPLRLIKK